MGVKPRICPCFIAWGVISEAVIQEIKGGSKSLELLKFQKCVGNGTKMQGAVENVAQIYMGVFFVSLSLSDLFMFKSRQREAQQSSSYEAESRTETAEV